MCSSKSILLLLLILLAGCRSITSATPTTESGIAPSPLFSANCMAGSYTEKISSNNQTRSYRLHIPNTYKPEEPIPLIFGFHGNGGTADQFEAYTGLSILADREGFIAIYPQGLGNPPAWNSGPSPENEDIQFVRDLINSIKIRCNIESTRIYAIGHSRGGGLANRLACNLADQIAAIASVSGTYEGGEDCAPTRPVSIVAIHGLDDPVVLYNGFPSGKNAPPNNYFNVGTPVPQWASAWAKRNGCNLKSSIILQKDPVSAQSWENCNNNANVILYTIKGWGHSWPRSEDIENGEFDSTQVIWDFLASHPFQQRKD